MKKRTALHILFWLTYYLGISLLSASYDQRFLAAFTSEALQLPLKLIMTYLFLYWLLPRYLFKGEYSRFLFGLLVMTLITGIINRIFVGLVILPTFYPELPFTPYDMGRFAWAVFDVFLPVSLAVSIKFLKLKYESIQREQALEKEKLRNELNFLKAQVQPHFLFNTLNNIYGLSLANAPETPFAILKLSGLFRFILRNACESSIPLRDEIQLLNDYVELERMRYGERLQFLFAQNVDDPEVKIAPLLLLPFVENSFKHGASESRFNAFIHISLVVTKGLLSFRIANSVEKVKKGTGIGLENIKRQLDLTYKKSYSLQSFISEKEYSVELNINLKEHANHSLHYN